MPKDKTKVDIQINTTDWGNKTQWEIVSNFAPVLYFCWLYTQFAPKSLGGGELAGA